VKAQAPGKIILSGEHAVVYGKPALVMAVDLYSFADLVLVDERILKLSLPDLTIAVEYDLNEIDDLAHRLRRRYESFEKDQLHIDQVLSTPSELFAFVFALFRENHLPIMEHGLSLQVRSNIPIGSGMGSSAASIISALMGLYGFYHAEFDYHQLFSLGLAAEKLAHGRPSGIDPYISLHGGFIRYQNIKSEQLEMPNLPFYLVNTGKPLSTTGECVSHVGSQYFNSTVWQQFESVTNAMQAAIEHENGKDMIKCVRENHRLLTSIGVTPKRVQEFIRTVEQRGGAAKIAGAGSIRGETAGVVLLVIEDNPQSLIEQFGYKLMNAKGESRGARIV